MKIFLDHCKDERKVKCPLLPHSTFPVAVEEKNGTIGSNIGEELLKQTVSHR